MQWAWETVVEVCTFCRTSRQHDADGRTVAASREAMSEAKIPLAYRDSCANLLIPLNRCRFNEYYLPWKCEVKRTT